jgi:glc operon protein GlcG
MPLVSRNHAKLTLEGAQAVLVSAEMRSKAMGVPMVIAVVDDGGHLMAFARMDGAKLSSVAVAINKACTSAIRRKPSGAALDGDQPSVLLSLALAISTKAAQTPIRGGVPLEVDGECVGAIGVSNGTEDQDVEVARAGAAALAGA